MSTPLNPDALEAACRTLWESTENYPQQWEHVSPAVKKNLRKTVSKFTSAYLAAALPEVTSVDSLLDTRAGLALANAAFSEGLSAGIRSCNAAEGDVPFKKPVSPYSAPLLAMIKADRPEVKP